MLDITTIILTYNEEIHIKRCLERITPYVKDVFIIDCFSNDNTLKIVENYKAILAKEGEVCKITVLQNPWVNYATQFNWALENAPIKTKWVLRLDADEYLSPALIHELHEKLPLLEDKYTGIVFPLRRVFMGKEINHGIAKGIKMLRLFQYGKASSEVRMMDEHIELLEGESVEFENSFSDDNLNNISWWSKKHIGYALREAIDLLDVEYDLTGSAMHTSISKIEEQALSKRKKKQKYAKMPLFWRSIGYFMYRYIFKLGFLDGKEGFCWDFFQGLWYRMLVDAKVYEIKKTCGLLRTKFKYMTVEERQRTRETLKRYINERFNISL